MRTALIEPRHIAPRADTQAFERPNSAPLCGGFAQIFLAQQLIMGQIRPVTVRVTGVIHHAAAVSDSTGSKSSCRIVSPEGVGFWRLNSTIAWAVVRLHPLWGSLAILLRVDTGMPVPRWMKTSPPMISAYGFNRIGQIIPETWTLVNRFRHLLASCRYSCTIPAGEPPK